MKYIYIAAGIAWFWLIGIQTDTEPVALQIINIVALLAIAGAGVAVEISHRDKN